MKLLTQLGKVKANGECPVYVVCYIKGERARFKTGVDILPCNFDNVKGEIVGSHTTLSKQNTLLINNCKKRITQIEVNYKLQHKELTTELLKMEFETPAVHIDFIQFFDVELKKRKGLIADGTYRQNESVLEKLKKYKKEIFFCEVNEDFLNDFKKWCKKQGNEPNTIAKNLSTLRIYIRIAVRKKIIDSNPFDGVKITQVPTNPDFLTPEELHKIVDNYKRGMFPKHIAESLQSFLFSCFTGIRLTDVRNLEFDNIINDNIVFKPGKTAHIGKVVCIPLTKAARALIEWEHMGKRRKVFSMKTNEAINRDLKAIEDLLSIDRHIHYHTSRHTFATNYLRQTNDLAGLQKLLGHSKITQTMVYAHVLQRDIEKNILSLDKYWK